MGNTLLRDDFGADFNWCGGHFLFDFIGGLAINGEIWCRVYTDFSFHRLGRSGHLCGHVVGLGGGLAGNGALLFDAHIVVIVDFFRLGQTHSAQQYSQQD